MKKILVLGLFCVLTSCVTSDYSIEKETEAAEFKLRMVIWESGYLHGKYTPETHDADSLEMVRILKSPL